MKRLMNPRSIDRAVRRFNYSLQVWTINGIIQRCGHPDRMRTTSRSCCNAYELAGRHINRIEISLDPCFDGCYVGCSHDTDTACPWTSIDECRTAREEAVAGTYEPMESCMYHDV